MEEWKRSANTGTGRVFAASHPAQETPAWRATLQRLNQALKDSFRDGAITAPAGPESETPVAPEDPDSKSALQFVILGQSNAAPGRGQTTKISQEDQARIRAVSQRAEVCGWYWEVNTCANLSTVSKPHAPLTPDSWGWFGPDLFAALMLAESHPAGQVRVIKADVMSGATLATDYAAGGAGYEGAVRAIEQHMLPGASLGGIIWIQGEGDTRDASLALETARPPRAATAEDAAAYAANLQAFICRLRAVTAKTDPRSCASPLADGDSGTDIAPGTPFLMVEPWAGTSATCTPSESARAGKAVLMRTVRQQMHAWPGFTLLTEDVASLPRYCNYTEAEISADRRNYDAYQGHYSTEGQKILGSLVAQWMVWPERASSTGAWSPGPRGAGGAWLPEGQGPVNGPGGAIGSSVAAQARQEPLSDDQIEPAPTSRDLLCYATRYPDLAAALGNDTDALLRHWSSKGRAEGRDPYCALDRDLPFKVFNVGLPKSGSSSVLDYFRCGGVTASHWLCGEGGEPARKKDIRRRECGRCALLNHQAGRPILEGCGEYQVWAQLDSEDAETCFLPQVEALGELHDQFPDAMFILPLRPVEHWLASVNEWHGMRQRLQKCRSMQQVVTDDDYKQYYYNHTQTIREFVAAHPSHKLVEFDVEAVAAGTALEDATGVPSTCWGQRNCLASCRFWRRQSRSAPPTS